jgi:DNA-binding FadR family transcriptional regulator
MPRRAALLVDSLKAYLAEQQLALHARLPPERDLCRALGTSRSSLRKALAVLEAEGRIWRHVGRGTFVGSRPIGVIDGVPWLASRAKPAEVMEARLALEPELARLAALHATPADLDEIAHCISQTKAAREWRVYEHWDNLLHHAIARASGNGLLLALFDTLNGVRRAVVWGRLRTYRLTPDLSHHSFAEHDAIVAALRERDMGLAAAAMRRHLESVRDHLIPGSVGHGGPAGA